VARKGKERTVHGNDIAEGEAENVLECTFFAGSSLFLSRVSPHSWVLRLGKEERPPREDVGIRKMRIHCPSSSSSFSSSSSARRSLGLLTTATTTTTATVVSSHPLSDSSCSLVVSTREGAFSLLVRGPSGGGGGGRPSPVEPRGLYEFECLLSDVEI